MADMRAKMVLHHIENHYHSINAGTEQGQLYQQNLWFHAVGRSSTYPQDGSDENNTYAKYTPTANLGMTVLNPDLFGKFKEGDTFYVDFTKVQNV